MIDMEAEVQRIATEAMAKFAQQQQQLPAVRATAAVTDTHFAAMPTVGKFESLIGGEQFQAAAGMFNRMVACTGVALDEPSDRVGEILLNGARRDLSQMWQFVTESQATDPDVFAAAEFGLLREVMAATVADHGSRSDRRKQFFQSVLGGELGSSVLTATTVDWLCCR